MGGYVTRSGSTGIDHSANAAAVPVAGWSLLVSISPNARRNFIEVQNQSAANIQLVRDDGFGNNLTSIIIAGAAAAGSQGGGWTSDTFKGRLRIYALSPSAQVAAYED